MTDHQDPAASVWLRPQRARRDTPPLTRERIVTEAVALLDEEGVSGLTMRRLAERLGTGSTTLYWHVSTKDDVLDLAVDEVFGEVPVPPGGNRGRGTWRGTVAGVLHELRAALLRHPWAAGLVGRPLIGPNALARQEFLHAELTHAGFTGAELTRTAYALSNYLIGSAMMQTAWQVRDEPAARRAADAHVQAQRDRYPTLADGEHLLEDDWDASFTRGLDYLLDGIAAQSSPPRD